MQSILAKNVILSANSRENGQQYHRQS
jgi:hypothetical protein